MSERIKDRYEPLEVLASGERTDIVRAMDHQHGRVVAMKVRSVGSDEHRDALHEETRILVDLLPHPNLPRIREGFFDGDKHYLVTDWVEGRSLWTLLHDEPGSALPFQVVIGPLRELATAIDHLHRHEPSIVHGDIRPGNAVITEGGRTVLVGLGKGEAGAPAEEYARELVAPEVAAGGPRTAASDIYGLASTAFVLLTGSPPSNSDATYPTLPGRAIGIVERTLRRGLDPVPGRRPASAAELVDRLASWVETALPSGTVTFLMSDIEGSTRMWESYGEQMAVALSRHDEIVDEIVDRNGGVLLKTRGEGDSTFSVFEAAGAGVRAAVEIQRALAAEPWVIPETILSRMGMHSGEAQIREGDYYGPVVNRCARLRGLGGGGQILISDATYELVRDAMPAGVTVKKMGVADLKDLERAEEIYDVEVPEVVRSAAGKKKRRSSRLRRSRLVFAIPPLVIALIAVSTLAVTRQGPPDDLALRSVYNFAPVEGNEVVIRRTYSLIGREDMRFRGEVRFTNSSPLTITLDWTEVIPPSIATQTTDVVFTPPYAGLVRDQAPLAVGYRIQILPGWDDVITYETPFTLPPGVEPESASALWEGQYRTALAEYLAVAPDEFEPDLPPKNASVKISGSGTTAFLMKVLGEVEFERVAPRTDVIVHETNDADAFRLFCAGKVDVVATAVPLTNRFASVCVDHVEVDIAREALTLVTSTRSIWLDCLTVPQLAELWDPGKRRTISTWAHVRPGEWPDVPVSLHAPVPHIESVYGFFARSVAGKRFVRADRSFTDFQTMADAIADRTGSLGYLGYSTVTQPGNAEKLKIVSVDAGQGCVAPGPQTVADGTYQPLGRTHSILVARDALARAEVSSLVRFVLSNAGPVLQRGGYIALDEASLAQERLEAGLD